MRWKNKKGSVLITLIIALVLMAVLGAGIYGMTTSSSFSELLSNRNDNAYQLAKAGIRYAVETGGTAVGDFLMPNNSKKFNLAFDVATNEITSTGIVNEGTFLEARRVLKHTLAVTVSPVASSKFELSFDGRDNAANKYTALMGTWSQQNGNLVPTGSGEQRLVFEHGDGSDYRISVNATLRSDRGYGIYYRSNGLSAISGYCFQYDPGLNSPGIAFVVRKVVNGNEQDPFQRINLTAAQFPDIYNHSHQISITVQGNHHIIKMDGAEIMNFTDNTFLTGRAGLRSWDGQSTTLFHHVLIHSVPPLATGEIVWWSFEEGSGNVTYSGNVAYGAGFDIGVAENNGTLSGITRESRGIFGAAVSSVDSGHHIDVPNAVVLNPTGQFTIEAWVRPTTDSQTAEIVFKGSVGNRGHGLYQNISNSHENGGWNAQVYTTAGVVRLCWGEERPTSNTWYHLLLSVYGTSATLYVDGAQKARATLSGSVLWNSDNMIIGNDFRGIIDEVFFYKKALTAGEALGRFNLRKDNRW